MDWAPEALAGFREWLRKEYDGLERLNSTWNTSFASWDAVVPMTAEEAQKHGNFAPWSDHRVYMEQVFVKAFAQTREWLREIDPQARPSISGTQVPTAHNGCNWYAIDQEVEYIQPYSGGSQDAMHYLFNPKLLITGFTGYGMVGEGAKYQQWQRLFYGHTGASIFWHYTLLNPDLAFSEQGQALAEAFGRLQSGIGRRLHELAAARGRRRHSLLDEQHPRGVDYRRQDHGRHGQRESNFACFCRPGQAARRVGEGTRNARACSSASWLRRRSKPAA